jgi:hypothetical protein
MPEISNLFHLKSHFPSFVTGQKKKKMGHDFLGRYFEGNQANQKIWNYSSPDENKKKNTEGKIYEVFSSSGAADV